MKKYCYVFVFVLVLVTGCLSEDHPLVPFDSFQPIAMDDGWERSTPARENIDSAALTQIFEDVHNDRSLWQLRSLLVFRHNRLVAESYLKDAGDATSPRAIWSCTKQVLAILVGIAVEQGHIQSVHDPVSRYLPTEMQRHPDKAAITIENVLTMRSGIDFDERDDAAELLQELPTNTLDYILGLRLLSAPGQMFNYNSGDPHLVAAAIQNSVGKPTDEWADEVFFSRIGFSNYQWLRYDNYSFGGWGIATTPRELAKIAHVVLNGGAWNGAQVVESAWIDTMLFPHVPGATDGNTDFGYLWWNIRTDTRNLPYMAGSGGQYAVLVPEKDLVIIGMSEHDTDGDLELSSGRFLEIVQRIIAISE